MQELPQQVISMAYLTSLQVTERKFAAQTMPFLVLVAKCLPSFVQDFNPGN